MAFLVAVVVFLAISVMFNLLLTLGLVRRARAHSDLLSEFAAAQARFLKVGTTVPVLSAESVRGIQITTTMFGSSGVIAFLSDSCSYCRRELPELVAYIQDGGYPPERVLAVVAASDRDDAGSEALTAMLETLGPIATIVREPRGGGVLAEAFKVDGYPSFYLTDSGAIAAAGSVISRFPDAAAIRIAPMQPASGRASL